MMVLKNPKQKRVGNFYKELKQLKDSIDDAIEEKKLRDSFKKSNPKAVAITWILIAVLISIYRYITF